MLQFYGRNLHDLEILGYNAWNVDRFEENAETKFTYGSPFNY